VEPRSARHVVVIAGGDVPVRPTLDASWPEWDAQIAAVVAADGGLANADALGLAPTCIVGDLDSADPARVAEAAASGVRIVRATVAKDESDTELAVIEAVRLGATSVTILGALGGPRLDHALANVWLLALPALAGIPAVLLDQRARVALLTAPVADGGVARRRLAGPAGSIVSLLPFGGDVDGVTTTGLRYPLRDEPLLTGPARGLSNVVTGPDAAVAVRRGRLLVVEAADTGGGLSSES
jgi:thiamine pyrophosphokinase